MNNVIDLQAFRQSQRQAFFRKHGGRLDRFMKKFVDSHIDVEFWQIQDDYQELCAQNSETWDYIRFREVLSEALEEAFGSTLMELLKREPWFDRRVITREELVERCLSAFIMSTNASALIKR